MDFKSTQFIRLAGIVNLLISLFFWIAGEIFIAIMITVAGCVLVFREKIRKQLYGNNKTQNGSTDAE